MIVNDLDIVNAIIGPAETDPKLIVHTNAPLAGAVTGQPLQAVSRRQSEVIKTAGRVQHPELSESNASDPSPASGDSSLE